MKTNLNTRETAEATAWAESDEPIVRPDAKAQRGTDETRVATRAMLTETRTWRRNQRYRRLSDLARNTVTVFLNRAS